MSSACPTCNRALDTHDRHVRFGMPDPVLRLELQARTTGAWLSHRTPDESVMMQVPGAGSFVRSLLPIHLDNDDTITFGVWLGVHPADLKTTFTLWWELGYRDLTISGRLANAIPTKGLLGRPIIATVLDLEATPYCTSSPDPDVTALLRTRWPAEPLLNAVSTT